MIISCTILLSYCICDERLLCYMCCYCSAIVFDAHIWLHIIHISFVYALFVRCEFITTFGFPPACCGYVGGYIVESNASWIFFRGIGWDARVYCDLYLIVEPLYISSYIILRKVKSPGFSSLRVCSYRMGKHGGPLRAYIIYTAMQCVKKFHLIPTMACTSVEN